MAKRIEIGGPSGGAAEMTILAYLARTVTPDGQVIAAVAHSPETIVTLVRGAGNGSAIAALNAMSAGGEPQNTNCGRPPESEVLSQVGGSRSGVARTKLPEFTAVASKSLAWARRGGWLVIKIKAKYLVRGDVGQNGWVCRKNAPLEWAQHIPHPSPIAFTLPDAD